MKRALLFICAGLILATLSGCIGENDMAVYHITNLAELQAMSTHLADDCILDNDIDASATSGWNEGLGFDPIDNFSGSFDGQNHKITTLYINRPTRYTAGLFGYTNSATFIKNVGLENCDITGEDYVGGLVGNNSKTPVTNCWTTGSVEGRWMVGGLIGVNFPDYEGHEVKDCYSEATVTGGDYSGSSEAGGLIGRNDNGGLVSRCYAIGNVTGLDWVGGLIARNADSSHISNCYARGNVTSTGDYYIGGLLGGTHDSNVSNCYSTGLVTENGVSQIGGLIGWKSGTSVVSNSFWDTETSGQATSDGGTGKTTAEMNAKSTFTDAGWDFNTIWGICDPPTPAYPWLQWEDIECEVAPQPIIALIG